MLGATGNTVTGTNQVQAMSDTSAFYPSSGQSVFGPGFATTVSVTSVGTGVMTTGANSTRTVTGMPLYTTIRPVPQRIDTDSDWRVGIPAMNASLGLKTDGTLWGWGDNRYGQAGDGGGLPQLVLPVQIGEGSDWTMVEAGGWHSVGLKADGSLWAW